MLKFLGILSHFCPNITSHIFSVFKIFNLILIWDKKKTKTLQTQNVFWGAFYKQIGRERNVHIIIPFKDI